YTKYCDNSAEMWAVSQGSPIRSVIINGSLVAVDYCNPNFFTSGGFFANDEFNGQVADYTQQQFFTRNSDLNGWSNGVWNQVFLGDNGAPAADFGGTNQYTTIPTTPISEEPPYLTVDSAGNYNVFVPDVRRASTGPSYDSSTPGGTSIPIDQFLIATPSTPVPSINAAVA